MARLFSDLLDGSGRRYYFGLASAPGGITNAAPALLTLFSSPAAIQEQSTVFRTPATAALSLIGYSPQAEPHLLPAPAALSYGGQIPGLLKLQIITNDLPPDYTALPDITHTILFVQTITPVPGALTIQSLEHNITQGGNIGFISVGKATLSMLGYSPNMPRFGEIGTLTVFGLPATIATQLRIDAGVGSLRLLGLEQTLALPFTWTDDDPSPPLAWIDDPHA